MPSTLEVHHVFTAAVVGTPPFEFGIRFRNPDADPDLGGLNDLLDGLKSAFEDDLDDTLWNGLGAGELQATVTTPTSVTDYTRPLDSPSGGTQSYAAGASIRVVLNAQRPPGARNNALYLPLPVGPAMNQEGVISSGARDDVAAWAGDVLAAADGSGWTWSSRHQVGGPTAPITWFPVSGITVPTQGSYLNRRYR